MLHSETHLEIPYQKYNVWGASATLGEQEHYTLKTNSELIYPKSNVQPLEQERYTLKTNLELPYQKPYVWGQAQPSEKERYTLKTKLELFYPKSNVLGPSATFRARTLHLENSFGAPLNKTQCVGQAQPMEQERYTLKTNFELICPKSNVWGAIATFGDQECYTLKAHLELHYPKSNVWGQVQHLEQERYTLKTQLELSYSKFNVWGASATLGEQERYTFKTNLELICPKSNVWGGGKRNICRPRMLHFENPFGALLHKVQCVGVSATLGKQERYTFKTYLELLYQKSNVWWASATFGARTLNFETHLELSYPKSNEHNKHSNVHVGKKRNCKT